MSVVFILFGYLLGSVPFGLFVARGICGVDPRESGSGNVGATNVGRTCGMRYGVLTLALDLLKGILPVSLALNVGYGAVVVSLVALAALIGHCYSLFLGFKGGKGVATSIGIFLPIAWPQVILALLVHVALLFGSGYMSVASMGMALALFIFVLFSKPAYALLGAAVALVIFWRHRENILRLARGEENHWRKKDR